MLLPFSELLARPDAGTFFHAVAMGTVNANTLETSARQAAAMHDNTIDSTRGTVLVNGMGTAIMNNYFAAIYADEAAVGPSSSPVASAFSAITSAALDNSSFGKFFFANGTTNGTTNAAGPQLPVGGQTNVYGTAYNPPDPDPYGNSRPFQTQPYAGQTQALTSFTASTFVSPTPGGNFSQNPGPDKTTAQVWADGLSSSPAFPSGHTTYAFAGSLAFGMMVPELFQAMAYRASDYGYSRLVMGAHYPLDVIGGRITGSFSVASFLEIAGNMSQVESAAAAFRATVTAEAISDAVAEASALVEARRSLYTQRMTYGLPTTGNTTATAVVPEGAEVLLATRFPYLSQQQRRDVLASTQLPPGIVLDDGSGWATLNLFDAAGGFGRLSQETVVHMDAALGGLHASDVWNNNIGGPGSLIKTGTGTLNLLGANTYTGTTTVSAGTLLINGSTAGTSTVTVASGATLGGSGTVGGNTIISGTHSPGNSPGLQTFASNLSYEDGSTIVWELNSNTSTNRGTNFDGINVTGNLTFNGTTTLNLVFNGDGSTVVWANDLWATDQQWVVFNVAGTRVGTLTMGVISADKNGVLLAAIRPNASFSTTTSGNDILVSYSAIPEPSIAIQPSGGAISCVLIRALARRIVAGRPPRTIPRPNRAPGSLMRATDTACYRNSCPSYAKTLFDL